MYAVITTGGKQYRVAKDQYFKVESLNLEEGTEIEFNALMVVDGDRIQIGQPFVPGAVIKATVQANGRGKKVQIIKFRRRKHHMKRMGHRQNYTQIIITDIIPGQNTLQ